MPKHAGAGFFSGPLRDLTSNDVANAAQLKFPALDIALDLLTVLRSGTLSDDDERIKTPRSVAFLYRSGNLVVIERDLRNQNNVRAAGDAAVESDPARVPAHYFDDHHAFVTCGGGVQSVEGVHHFRHGGVETECHCRCFDVVVDRFRDADAIDAGLLHLHRGRHRTVPADNDERFDIESVQNRFCTRDDFTGDNRAVAGSDFSDEMAAIRRANNCPTQRHDSFGALAIKHDVIARRQQSFKAIAKSDYFPAKFVRGQRDAAKDGIQPWAVTAASENADSGLHNED